jgi:glucose-6-phosphate isomerase
MQQAEMESNGKSTDFDGNTVDYQTGALIWGEVGINGQHAFYQFMHQGTTIVPADFIGSVEPVEAVEGHHDTLMANYFAQMEALMNGVDADEIRADLTAKGKTEEEVAALIPHKIHRGNRPTNALLMEKITPRSLGSMIALYESKIFVQGIIWNICSFDQWGVELGKVMATKILPELAEGSITGAHDSSTVGLINRYKKSKNA